MLAQTDIPRGWGIYTLSARTDYFEFWNSVRARAPILDAGDGVFLLSSWDLVNAALRYPGFNAGSGVSQSFGGRDGPVERVVRNWLMSQSGDEHRNARGLVSALFAPRQLATLVPVIRAIAERLVKAFVDRASQGPTDFVSAIAVKLPSEVVRHLFAVESADWATHVEPLFGPPGIESRDAFAAVQALAIYFQDVVTNHRVRGGVIAQLQNEDKQGQRLTEPQVIANAVLIVTAAVDTTAGLIANTLYSLILNPGALDRVQHNFGLIPNAIDETLRHCPSAPSSTRSVPQALELGGISIPARSDLFLSIAAANRDPEKFSDPDRFDIDRDSSPLLTFGGGAHFCLGAALARLEAQILFETLFEAATNFQLTQAVSWRTDNPTVRAPQSLMMSCQAR